MSMDAIVIDLDGTLVNNNARAIPFLRPPAGADLDAHWAQFFKDSDLDRPNRWCKEIVESLHDKGYKIIFLTGRGESHGIDDVTSKWLNNNIGSQIDYDLIMRKKGDTRRDCDVKRDIILTKIAPHYNILFAVDDKRSNVDMFESLGIKCLHCADY